jgi:hypothetical protein
MSYCGGSIVRYRLVNLEIIASQHKTLCDYGNPEETLETAGQPLIKTPVLPLDFRDDIGPGTRRAFTYRVRTCSKWPCNRLLLTGRWFSRFISPTNLQVHCPAIRKYCGVSKE